MQPVHTRKTVTPLSAPARLVTQTPTLAGQSLAQVRAINDNPDFALRYNFLNMMRLFFADTCQVKNGGCDQNSICTHDSQSNAVVCICKKGYTNTGVAPIVVCTGKNSTVQASKKVSSTCSSFNAYTDSCQVNNGGCDANADCSHIPIDNAVKCTCKTGYVFIGTGTSTVCTGKKIPSNIAPR